MTDMAHIDQKTPRAGRLPAVADDIGDNLRMLRPAEAAELLGVSRRTIARLIAAGELPAVVISTGCRGVPLSALREFVTARTMVATS